jgi:hypothetical protein
MDEKVFLLRLTKIASNLEVKFLNRKLILLYITSVFAGMLLAFLAWLILGLYTSTSQVLTSNYKAEGFINSEAASDQKDGAQKTSQLLDVVSWQKYSKGAFPNLAKEFVKNARNENLQGKEFQFYQNLSSINWWEKHTSPIFMLSKKDVKDLLGEAKEFESDGNALLGIRINADSKTSKLAEEESLFAANFIRSGLLYIRVADLIKSVIAEQVVAYSDLESSTRSLKTYIEFLNIKYKQLLDLKSLETDKRSYTVNTIPKPESIKYFPLQVQLVANRVELSEQEQVLMTMEARKRKIELLSRISSKLHDLTSNNVDGFTLCKETISYLDSELRLPENQGNQEIEALNLFKSKVNNLYYSHLDGIYVLNSGSTQKVKLITYVAFGAFIGFLVILIGSLLSRISIKKISHIGN